MGSLAAVFCQTRPALTRNAPVHSWLAAAGLGCIVGSVLFFDRQTPTPSVWILIPTAGTALVLLYGNGSTWIGQLLAQRWLVFVGLISYSAYLWHQPILVFARLYSLQPLSEQSRAVLVLLTLGLAYLTWKFIEQPFRAMNKLSNQRTLCAALACSLGLTLVGIAGSAYSSSVGARVPASVQRAFLVPARTGECLDVPFAHNKKTGWYCNINPAGAQKPSFFVFGDSHGLQLVSAFDAAAAAAGRTGQFAGFSGCIPFLGVYPLTRQDQATNDCHALNLRVLAHVKAQMSPSQIIVLATPVFFCADRHRIGRGCKRQRNTYRLADAISSISLGMLSQTSAVFTRLLRMGIYTALFEHVALWRRRCVLDQPGTGWLLALVFYDFCYYWLHRMGHEVAVLWAAHVVHHQSQDYNLSTALRQTSSGALLGWVFYLPMALAGVPPLVFGVVALVDLLYQFWVHTEQVGKLGWFDRWFCSPSNHRVHHAVNDRYLDKNYGGILILWDRLFGTFKRRRPGEPCVYGTRGRSTAGTRCGPTPRCTAGLAQDSWHTRSWATSCASGSSRRAGGRPMWRSAFPSRPTFRCSWRNFTVLLGGVIVFLWHADRLPLAQAALWFSALTAGLWAVGAVTQGRIKVLEALLIQAAALATATSAAGLPDLYRVIKPLPMLIAIFLVATYDPLALGSGQKDSNFPNIAPSGRLWLLAALAGSLAGDVLLLFPGYFVPGLVAFLLAHVAYLVLLRQGVGWFPSRGALAATMGVGAAMYAFLWTGGLPAGLRARDRIQKTAPRQPAAA
jgi:alkylglycerol monooxygenase